MNFIPAIKLLLSPSLEESRASFVEGMQEQIKNLGYQAELTSMINDASIDRILVFDTQMRVIVWNKMCELITGFSKAEVIGKNFLDIFPELKASKIITEAIDFALKGFKIFVPAELGSFGDKYFEQHFIPLKNESGTIVGVLNIIHDVAHRAKMEQRLKMLNKSLLDANRELKLKNEELMLLAYSTNHDLREPLRKIYIFVDLILRKEIALLSPQTQSNFERIQAAVQKTSSLIGDIGIYLQIDTAPGKIATVELNRVLTQAKRILSQDIAAARAKIVSEKLPVIKGYGKTLALLFRHLIHNALKFQQEGCVPQIRISGRLIKGSAIKKYDAVHDHVYAQITVADNGIGFEKKFTGRIFQLFQRLNNAQSYSGNGIGLAICKKIVELHRGFITVESKPGQGSIFHCYLPSDPEAIK